MANNYKEFLKESEKKGFDLTHRKIINYNISKYEFAVNNGKCQYKDLDLAKKRTALIKHRCIENLDLVLDQLDKNCTANGIKVIWAVDAKEAVEEIIKIFNEKNVKTSVKMKSMVTEELELNEHLEKNKIEVFETDLGEFIVQIAHEKPYHIITPVMHKSKEIIADLFTEKFSMPKNSTPEEITLFVRKYLREKFIKADIGITGANFIIAENGAIALTENEGNGILTMSFPKTMIAIAGYDKIISNINDLQTIWPILATHGTGQKMTVYNSIISGPKNEDETDGPKEMYLILLSNNREKVLEKEHQRRAFSCIRCGACLNYCPIYKNIGGHTYNQVYTGPIGKVISPLMNNFNENYFLSYSSSLCGKCTEVCPAKIPLHELLLQNRNLSIKKKTTGFIDRTSMGVWKYVMTHRWTMNAGNASLKNLVLKIVFAPLWGKRRELPKVKNKNFNQLWKENEKKNV